MIKERTANTKRNIIYGLLQTTISLLFPFFVRTIFIYRLGIEYLGLNSLFMSILNVLSMMELGFGTAVVYSLYKPVADGNIDQICSYLNYFRKIYKSIGLCILGIGLILIPFLKSLIHESTLSIDNSIYAYYLVYLCNTVVSYFLFGYITVIPIAYQRRDILSRIDMWMVLIKCTIQATVLYISSNYFAFIIVIPVVSCIHNLVIAYFVKKRYPNLMCRGTLKETQKQELNKKVYGLVINKLTNTFRNSIDCICISSFIGLAMAGKYNNYYFIMMSVLSFSSIICGSMMASVGNSIVTELKGKNYDDLRLFDFIYMAIACWATVCMLCLYQPFIFAWIGKDMMLTMDIVIGISFYFFVLKSGDIRWIYHEGAGLWYECRFIMIGEAVANIVLNIVLCRFLGTLGIVLATIISVFVTNMILCPQVLFNKYFKNGKLREYWADHIHYTGSMLLSATVSWFMCEYILPLNMIISRKVENAILCIGGRLVICSTLSVLVFWSIWHRSEIYKTAKTWLKSMIKVKT